MEAKERLRRRSAEPASSRLTSLPLTIQVTYEDVASAKAAIDKYDGASAAGATHVALSAR